MNILRLSTLSLALAIAVFALGYVNPSFGAPKKCDGNPDTVLPGCGGTDDVAAEFTVELQPGGLSGNTDGLLVTSDGTCGTTEGENRGASFPNTCVTVCFITGPTGCPLALQLSSLRVRLSQSDMQLFFTSGPIPMSGPVSNDSVYQSDLLPVTIIRIGQSFEIPVDEVGLELTKTHKPMKGDLVGPIAIWTIVFTPI